METVPIIIKGNPVSVNSLYRSHRGRVHLSAKGKAWKEAVGHEALAQWKRPCAPGRLSVVMELYFGGKRHRDIDNASKALLDAFQGIVYENDDQIDELHIYRRHDDDNPRVECLISELE